MKMSPRHLALLIRRLADLLGGGLTLSRSLTALSRQCDNIATRDLARSLYQELAAGRSLSDAMKHHPHLFSPVTIGLTKAGESSGNLEGALDELASLLESEYETRQQIRTAMAYPVLLLALAVLVCLFLTIFVIPQFERLFDDLGQQLPLPTRLLILFSKNLKHFILPLSVAATFGGMGAFKIKPEWRNKFIHNLMEIPVISSLSRSASLQRWTRVMASLLRGGLPVSDALRLSRQTVGRGIYSDDIQTALNRLQEGRSLSSALSEASFFPPMLCELVGAGEESGRLDRTFERLAESCRREAGLQMKLALSFLEPALVLGMGLLVGFMAVAMLLPIFEMSANIR